MANPLANLGAYAHKPKTVKIVSGAQATSAPIKPMPSLNEAPRPVFAPLRTAMQAQSRRGGVQIPLQRGEPTSYGAAESLPKKKTVKIVRAK